MTIWGHYILISCSLTLSYGACDPKVNIRDLELRYSLPTLQMLILSLIFEIGPYYRLQPGLELIILLFCPLQQHPWPFQILSQLSPRSHRIFGFFTHYPIQLLTLLPGLATKTLLSSSWPLVPEGWLGDLPPEDLEKIKCHHYNFLPVWLDCKPRLHQWEKFGYK